MRVAIYARVSTDDQRCETQLDELRRFARLRDWIVYQEYTDVASGAKASRPGRNALMGDAVRGLFDAVIVYKLDRWGRSLQDVMKSIETLDDLKIRFIATSQNIDTDENSPTSRLFLQLLAAFAEFERSLIRERVKAGIEHAMKNGTRTGRPVGRTRKVWDRAEAYRLRVQGWPWSQLAVKFALSLTTVWDGVTEYAEQNGLKMPTAEEFAHLPARNVGSSKPPQPTTCRFCGTQYPTKKAEKPCCRKEKQAEHKRKLADHMRRIAKEREEKRAARKAEQPSQAAPAANSAPLFNVTSDVTQDEAEP